MRTCFWMGSWDFRTRMKKTRIRCLRKWERYATVTQFSLTRKLLHPYVSASQISSKLSSTVSSKSFSNS
jgi:hypothetical protein